VEDASTKELSARWQTAFARSVQGLSLRASLEVLGQMESCPRAAALL